MKYLQQSIGIRLGGLSADLLLSDRVEDAARLVEIQLELTRWHRVWNEAQHDPALCARLSEQARAWSDEILAMSGLVDQE